MFKINIPLNSIKVLNIFSFAAKKKRLLLRNEFLEFNRLSLSDNFLAQNQIFQKSRSTLTDLEYLFTFNPLKWILTFEISDFVQESCQTKTAD